MHGWLRLVDRTYVKMHGMAEVHTMLNDLGLVTDRACRFVAKPFYGMMWCVAKKVVPACAARGQFESGTASRCAPT